MVKLTFCLRVSFAMCLKHVCQRKRNDVSFCMCFLVCAACFVERCKSRCSTKQGHTFLSASL